MSEPAVSESPTSPQTPTRRVPRGIAFLICVILALVAAFWFRTDPDLEPATLRALFILMLAVLLWTTDAIPAFAVSLLVIALNVALLGRPGGVYAKSPSDWEQFVEVFGHPLIWLFFGGFVLAAGMERCGLDRKLALSLLRRTGGSYPRVLLAVMLGTFLLSMFMSNTATTAMMLAVLAPLLAQSAIDSNAGRGLVLGIAVAANLGGMGSLIGTPPNAIAVASLAKLTPPQEITFLDWMIIGLPPAAITMVLVWRYILWSYPEAGRQFEVGGAAFAAKGPPATKLQLTVTWVALISTIGLWLTSSWHGIPSGAVALLPIVLLTSTGVLTAQDIRGLNYDVLFLMAGGLALGTMITSTHLSAWVVQELNMESFSPMLLVISLTYLTVILSNFMSATAAANIVIPLAITMAPGSEAVLAIAVALGVSCAMCLPVATPPNAMVFSTGRLRTSNLVQVGLIIGLLTPALCLLWMKVCLPLVL
jgi:sodium-dependent dicarboxylate transporter 2/3/5